MPDPTNVSITTTLTPCNFTLHQDEDLGADSVIWTNNTTSPAIWTMAGASDVLATTAPPNEDSPAADTYTINPGQTLQLWVSDDFQVGDGVNKQYNVSVNGTNISCINADPPDMQIEP